MRLHQLPPGQAAIIAGIDPAELSEGEVKRLRELGVDEGVSVALLHAAPLGGDPIACRIGRMTVALRRAMAAAVLVEQP